MLNPPPSGQDSGSYVDLLNRMTRRVKGQKAAEQILELVRQIFEQELDQENIVLSKPERRRLLGQVTQAVLTETLGGLDSAGRA